MKKAFAFLSVLLVAALALTSCETIVDVDPPQHTPRLALSYTLSNQVPSTDYYAFFGSRQLYVSTSQGVFETKGLQGRTDAAVELRNDANEVVEVFRARGRAGYYGQDSLRGYYVPTRGYIGQPGGRYTLRASAPGVEPVEATLTLPAPATIEAASYVPKSTDPYSNGGLRGRLSFVVPDNAASTDYYVAYARVLDASGRLWGNVMQDYSATNNDPDIDLNRFRLSENGSAYSYGLYPISDVGRNGQRLSCSSDVALYYTGMYDPQQPTPPKPAFVEIIVSSLSRDTYDFYLSVQRYNDVDGNPFAEPAPLRSNIKSGYGLFGGAADATFRIPL
jgi:hypothetical protein